MRKRLIFKQHYLCSQHFSSRARGLLLSLSGFWKCQSVRVANANDEVTEPQLSVHCREKNITMFYKNVSGQRSCMLTKCTKKSLFKIKKKLNTTNVLSFV